MNEVYLAVLFGCILVLLLSLKANFFAYKLYSLYFKLIKFYFKRLGRNISVYETAIFAIAEPQLWNYFEHYLETLEATIDLIIHEKKQVSLSGVYKTLCFIDECNQRSHKIKKVLSQYKKFKKCNFNVLKTKRRGIRSSCYFCSQPILYNMFAKLATVVEGAVVKVSSCKDCKEAMEAQQKINILFFQEKDQRVHWSVHSDYIPTNDFWTMNKLKKPEPSKTLSLHLVSNNKK